MATYNLNLASSYCQHWGLWEAIREILQNGEDQFTLNNDNEISVVYDEKNQKLLISNKESILERKTLLLGCTSKDDNDNLIGKFGEGYKIALLILTKLNKKIVIKNFMKNEKWTPELKKDPKYENEKVLKVNIKSYFFKRDRDNNLTWEINGITKEDWNFVNEKYLRYQDLGSTFTTDSGAQILFEERYRGCVYVNGLFIEKIKSNMAYGYNLMPNTIQLDRDRKTVEGFDFFYETKNIISKYAQKHPERISDIMSLVENTEKPYEDFKYFLEPSSYTEQNVMSLFSKHAQESFELENKTPSFPVANEREKRAVLAYYPMVRTSIVSNKKKAMLSSTSVYKNIDSFMSVHGSKNKKQELSPNQLMKMFMDDYASNIYDRETLNALNVFGRTK